MGRVVIKHCDESPRVDFPKLEGASSSKGVLTRAVFADLDRPLFLWKHELEAGAEISWNSPLVAHLLYVIDGDLEVGEKALGTDSVVIVEHKAGVVVRA